MSTVTWHLLEICSGIGDDDVRVYAIELDVDDSLIEPRRTALVAARDRGWARTHLCLDYLLSAGSRADRRPLDRRGLSLFQGHLHPSSPSDPLDVQPVCVWVDERARRRYEPTAGNSHAPLLFEALGALPFAASPQDLVALACAARRRRLRPPRSAPGVSGAQVPAIPRRASRRLVAAALAQCALAVLLLFGGSPPAFPQLTTSGPLTYVASSTGPIVVDPLQPPRSPAQMEPLRFTVLQVEESEEPE
jgi:hypothetical protein